MSGYAQPCSGGAMSHRTPPRIPDCIPCRAAVLAGCIYMHRARPCVEGAERRGLPATAPLPPRFSGGRGGVVNAHYLWFSGPLDPANQPVRTSRLVQKVVGVVGVEGLPMTLSRAIFSWGLYG